MALISNFKRLNSTVCRMVPLANEGFILDTIPYDKNYVNLSTTPTDVSGVEELAFSNSWINESLVGSSYVHSIHYRPLLTNNIDISTDNPSLGGEYLQDPYEEGVMYVITTFPYTYSSSTGYQPMLYKLDANGKILKSTNLVTMLGNYGYFKFMDITKEYILIRIYKTDASYYDYYWKINKSDLTQVADTQFNNMSVTQYSWGQCFHRDGTNMYIVHCFETGSNLQFSKINHSTTPFFYTNLVVNGTKKFPTRPYNGTYSTPFTPKMANGFHYRVNGLLANKGTPWKFEAFSLDTSTDKINVLLSEDIVMDIDPKCHPDYLNMLVYDDIYASDNYGGRLFNIYKVDQEHFVVFFTIRPYYTNYTLSSLWNNNKKSYYILCKINPDDPLKLSIKNIQPLDDLYTSEPIKVSPDKYILIRPNMHAHMYKVDVKNYEVNNVWQISTPNIWQATWYNNRFWWLNWATKELNFEVEGDSRVVTIETDKESYVLENDTDIQNGTVKVACKASDGTYIASKVRLNLTGPARFKDNSSNEIEINTATGGPVDVSIEVYNGGVITAVATILDNKTA